MKNYIFVLLILLFISCGNNKKTDIAENHVEITEVNNPDSLINNDEVMETLKMDFKSLINKVPITELPIGIKRLDKLDSLIKPDGSSALLLYNEKTEEELTLDLKFHLKQGSNELTII